MTDKTIRFLAIIAALILLATAGFHMTAMTDLRTALGQMDPGFYRNGLPAMWTLPALHWVLIACLSVGLSRYNSQGCAAVLIAFGLWVLLDAAIAAAHVGLFIGVYMLSAAGICLLIAGFKLRKTSRAK